jgi:hypothetical protein
MKFLFYFLPFYFANTTVIERCCNVYLQLISDFAFHFQNCSIFIVRMRRQLFKLTLDFLT